MSQEVLMKVTDLKKHFPLKGGGLFGRKIKSYVKAVDGVSFEIFKGETLGIVGESGCGKSTTGKCLIRLIDPSSGSVMFKGKEITTLQGDALREVWQDLQIVFQDPFASLNPRMRIGEILTEPLENYQIGDQRSRREKVQDMLAEVGLRPDAINRFPHEFSGGQRQRIGLARALVLNPELIIADEPVSALDVSIQSQVLNLMRKLQKEHALTYLFISHDLSVVKHMCDRIGVMYLGSMVELAPKRTLYEEPLHPYTKALLSAVPIPNPKQQKQRIVLSGDVPSPSNPPSGCPFHTRCPEATDFCKQVKPSLINVDAERKVACHLYENQDQMRVS